MSAANLSKWAAQKIDEINPLDVLFKKKKKAFHPGPLNQLKMIEEPLLCYIFELWEQGLTINTFVIALKESHISTKFYKKSFTARCSAVKQFCYAHSITYQMCMHMSQHPSAENKSQALDYMQFMCQIVLGNSCNRRFLLNMDQTPFYFLMNAKRTLDLIKKQMVHIHTSSDNTKRGWDGASIYACL